MEKKSFIYNIFTPLRGCWSLPRRIGRRGYVFIFLIAVLSIVGLSVFTYQRTFCALTDLEISRKRDMVRLTSALVYTKLDIIRSVGISLAMRPGMIAKINQGDWTGAINVLEGVLQAFHFVDRIFIADRQAVIQEDLPHMQAAVGSSRSDQDWYKGVSKNWRPYISEVLKRKSEPRLNVVDVAIPIKVDPANLSVPVDPGDPKGKVLAILVLQIKLDNFSKLIAQLHLNRDEIIYIVDQRGHIVYHPRFPPQGDIIDFSNVQSVRKLLRGVSGVELIKNPIEHTTRLSAFERVEEYGWGVVLAQPVSVVFAERDRKMAGMLLIFLVFFVASIVFIYLVLKLLEHNEKIAEEMSDLYNHSPCGYHSLDKDGTFIRINDTELAWLGYTRDEVVGKLKFSDIITSDYLKKFQEEFPRFKERGWVSGLEFEMLRKDGTTFPAYLNAVAIKDAAGNFLRTRSIIFDTTERDKLANAIVASEERFRLLSETSMVGIFIIQDNVMKYANPAVPKMLGYAYEELVKLGPEKVLHPEDCGPVLENTRKQQAGEGGKAQHEVRMICKDGSVRCFESFEVRIDYEGHPAVSVTILDITERKKLEAELKVKNILLTCQAEAAIDGLLAVDENGKIISFNQRFVDMWHVPAKALAAKDDEPVLRWVTSCLSDQESFLKKVLYLYEHRDETSRDELYLQDGRVFDRYSSPMSGSDGKYYGRVWYFRDITEKHMFEKRLKRAAYEWRRTFDSITDFMFLLDKHSCIVQVNMAFCNALKLKPPDVIGKKCTEIDDQGYFLPKWSFQDILKDGKAHTEAVKGRNGIPFLLSISPVFDEQQAMIGAVFVARDISVQKQAEQRLLQAYEELKLTQDKLIQSEKMASIGQLAAGVAHEINNPVGFVSSNLEVMTGYIYAYLQVIKLIEQAQVALEKQDFEAVKSIIGEIEEYEKSVNLKFMVNDSELLLQQSQEGMARIAKIVADLKNMAREDIQWLEEPVKVEEILDQVLTIAHNELKYRIELCKSFNRTPQVRCSAQKMGQVFLNLIMNAAQAIDGKGVIEIRTYEQDRFVCVDIRDTGCGIPPENLKRIFDPFFTTKPTGQGTGLGLSISYDIVKKHRGDIVVTSEVGKGTTFTVSLPLPLARSDIKA